METSQNKNHDSISVENSTKTEIYDGKQRYIWFGAFVIGLGHVSAIRTYNKHVYKSRNYNCMPLYILSLLYAYYILC